MNCDVNEGTAAYRDTGGFFGSVGDAAGRVVKGRGLLLRFDGERDIIYAEFACCLSRKVRNYAKGTENEFLSRPGDVDEGPTCLISIEVRNDPLGVENELLGNSDDNVGAARL